MPRRRPDDFLPDVPEEAVGMGTPDIPFDQTAPLEEETMAPPSDAGAAPGMIADLGMQGPVTDGDPGMSDQLSDNDLMALASEDPNAADQLSAAFADPNTAPADMNLLQQRLALAARRRMAGAV